MPHHQAQEIYSDKFKGIMTPPVLVDITSDGVLDIVMAMFNSSVIAFDGLNFARLWEYNQPSSESYRYYYLFSLHVYVLSSCVKKGTSNILS